MRDAIRRFNEKTGFPSIHVPDSLLVFPQQRSFRVFSRRIDFGADWSKLRSRFRSRVPEQLAEEVPETGTSLPQVLERLADI